jgi:hypothetical protein
VNVGRRSHRRDGALRCGVGLLEYSTRKFLEVPPLCLWSLTHSACVEAELSCWLAPWVPPPRLAQAGRGPRARPGKSEKP